jgi:hypothetical protein
MDDRQAKAFDFSQDAAKQLITLSTAVVALTITFYKDFATGAGHASKVLMTIGWGLFLLSIFAGVAHLFALTGALAPKDGSALNLHTPIADISLGAQQLLFVGALFFTVLAAVLAL